MVSVRSKPRGPGSDINELCTQLRGLAYAEGPGAKLPTVRELCASFGTHPPALDGALSLLEAQHILVRKHGHGIYVSPRVHRKTIAVLLDSSFFQSPGTSPIWGMLYGIIAREAEKRMEGNRQDFEFHMTTWMSDPDHVLPGGVMASVRSGAIHGVLGVGLSNEAAAWLTKQDITFVAYGGRAPWNVVLDYDACCRGAIRSLSAQGCRRIGCWSVVRPSLSSDPTRPFLNRYGNIAALFADCGAVLDPELLRASPDVAEAGSSNPIKTHQEQGYELAMSVFASSGTAKPDGLFIDDDMLTNGALIALQKLGIRVGKDVKVATHANAGSIVLFGYEDRLTLVEFDPMEIVREMFALLDGVLAGRMPTEPIVLLKPRLR